MMKLVVVLALVACASAAPGVVAGVLPASTGPLTYAVAGVPTVVAGPQVVAAPQVLAAPAITTYSHAPATIVAPAAVQYATAPKITQVHEPVEQHGYQIAY